MAKARFQIDRDHPSFLRTAFKAGLICFLSAVTVALPAFSQDDSGEYPPLWYMEACFREAKDAAWGINIVGNVPSLAGCFLIVHNADRLVATFFVPHGTYTSEQPLTFDIPADGFTGDYRMIFTGTQRDIMGIRLPLSTLKGEVYGYGVFATNAKKPLWFIAPNDVSEFEFTGARGPMRIFDENGNNLGETIWDPQATKEKQNPALKLTLKPGKRYGFEQVNVFYMSITPGAYVTFDPERLFLPDPRLRQFAWWRVPGLSSSGKATPASLIPENASEGQTDSGSGD